MQRNRRFKLAGGVAAIVAALGAGGAIAATQLSPTEESDAILEDAAKELGVDADELDAALTQAIENRIDAAVDAGRLTEEQGAELKERLASGDFPLVALGPGFGHHVHAHGVPFEAAAAYLGLDQEELQTRLEDGDTLAEIARAEGKSVDGLVAALVAEARANLDEKVEEGRLTEAQRTEILGDLESRIEALVNGEAGFRFRGDGPRHGFGGFGPAPSEAPDA